MPKERRDALRAGYRAADKNLHLPRKQISETGTYGIASEEDTGSRVAEGWMSMSSTYAERRKPSPRASAAVQRDVRVMKPDKIVL